MGRPFFSAYIRLPALYPCTRISAEVAHMVLEWLRAADNVLWGPGTLALLVGTGAFLTIL